MGYRVRNTRYQQERKMVQAMENLLIAHGHATSIKYIYRRPIKYRKVNRMSTHQVYDEVYAKCGGDTIISIKQPSGEYLEANVKCHAKTEFTKIVGRYYVLLALLTELGIDNSIYLVEHEVKSKPVVYNKRTMTNLNDIKVKTFVLTENGSDGKESEEVQCTEFQAACICVALTSSYKNAFKEKPGEVIPTFTYRLKQ